MFVEFAFLSKSCMIKIGSGIVHVPMVFPWQPLVCYRIFFVCYIFCDKIFFFGFVLEYIYFFMPRFRQNQFNFSNFILGLDFFLKIVFFLIFSPAEFFEKNIFKYINKQICRNTMLVHSMCIFFSSSNKLLIFYYRPQQNPASNCNQLERCQHCNTNKHCNSHVEGRVSKTRTMQDRLKKLNMSKDPAPFRSPEAATLHLTRAHCCFSKNLGAYKA